MHTTFKPCNAFALNAICLAGAAIVTALLIGSQLGIASDYVAQADAAAVAKGQSTLAQKAEVQPSPRSPS